MNKIKNIRIVPLKNSIYVRPKSLIYEQDGKEKKWDFLNVHKSVSVVLFNISREVLIFVKQFRPAVYVESVRNFETNLEVIDHNKYPPELGITIELCAGIVDKNIPLVEIAKEEILEECGYDVPLASLKKISTFRASVGVTGSFQTMFYCEVSDQMKVTKGGGIQDELIDVVEMTIKETENYIQQDSIQSPGNFLFAIYWFFEHFRNSKSQK